MEDSGREYKTFRGLTADIEPPEFKDQRGRSIHLFLSNNSLTSLSCRRNQDGTYSGTLALKTGGASPFSLPEAPRAPRASRADKNRLFVLDAKVPSAEPTSVQLELAGGKGV